MITVHAGHNPSGKIACGASHFLDESTEARFIAREVAERVKGGCENITVNNGISQSDILVKLVTRANKTNAKFHVSFHLNSGAKHKKDGKTTGCEVLVYDKKKPIAKLAKDICFRMEKLGYNNRGVKERKDLYFLKKTVKPALLVECCFVDDRDDANLWKKTRSQVAKVIADCINDYLK